MGFPSYVIDNNIQDSGGISSSSADSVFVTSNLFDSEMAKPFRWDETISTSLVLFIEIDFGVAKAADMIAIMNHNFASDTTFVLKTGTAASPSGVTATPLWREKDIWISFTDPSHRFYRLEITLGTIVAPVPIPEIGELFIGTKVDLTFHMAFGMERGVQQNKIQQQTQKGVRWIFDQINRRFFEAKFATILDAHIAELDLLDRRLNGEATPFLFIPDISLTDIYMVRKVGDHVESNARNTEWNVDIRLEEEPRGVDLTNVAKT